MYYIESKATWEDRFDFRRISDTQYEGLINKDSIEGVFGLVIILFASYQRAFILNIHTIDNLIQSGQKSINIKKIDKWDFEYDEVKTIPNSRKTLLDYDIEGNVL